MAEHRLQTKRYISLDDMQVAGVSEKVRLLSNRMFEGQAGIKKNRSGFVARFIALAKFGRRVE